jgi:hypothetical protein
VTEALPPFGMAGAQQYLVNVALTTVQTIAFLYDLPVAQIAAKTVHAKIAINPRRAKKVTKPMVRNGVINLIPELADRKKDWTKVFDEPDAIAVGLAYMGYHNGA